MRLVFIRLDLREQRWRQCPASFRAIESCRPLMGRHVCVTGLVFLPAARVPQCLRLFNFCRTLHCIRCIIRIAPGAHVSSGRRISRLEWEEPSDTMFLRTQHHEALPIRFSEQGRACIITANPVRARAWGSYRAWTRQSARLPIWFRGAVASLHERSGLRSFTVCLPRCLRARIRVASDSPRGRLCFRSSRN
ncbi:hypothetical protein BD414DRAFT_471597 [Trametes punicea]|nr:hypothetical protein BD414DRAFT_471597 [Trametes punicea]